MRQVPLRHGLAFAMLSAILLLSAQSFADPTPPSVQNGVSFRLYQTALDKVVKELPTVFPQISYNGFAVVLASSSGITRNSGAGSPLDCSNTTVPGQIVGNGNGTTNTGDSFGYAVGVRNGSFFMSLDPQHTNLSLKFSASPQFTAEVHSDGELNCDNLQGQGLAGCFEAYVDITLFGHTFPLVSANVSMAGLDASVSLWANIYNNQLVVTQAHTPINLHHFELNIPVFTAALKLLTFGSDVIVKAINNALTGVINDQASAIATQRLPCILTTYLNNKLDYTNTILGLQAGVQGQALSSNDNGLTLTFNSSVEAQTPVACPSGANCNEPAWAATTGQPSDAPPMADDCVGNPDPKCVTDGYANAGVNIGVSAINQAMFAAWRAGKLAIEQDINAEAVVAALLPGLNIAGSAHIEAHASAAPLASLPTASAKTGASDPGDLTLSLGSVATRIKIIPTGDATPIDLSIETEVSATGVIEITPPFFGDTPNPVGNRVQVYLKEMNLGKTTLTYGPSVSVLTDDEKQRLLTQLIMPIYQSKIGVIPIANAVLTFNAQTAAAHNHFEWWRCSQYGVL